MFYKKLFFVLAVVACVVAVVKGSCLEYGHSCWGGHGKRSSGVDFRSRSDDSLRRITRLEDLGGNDSGHQNSITRNPDESADDWDREKSSLFAKDQEVNEAKIKNVLLKRASENTDGLRRFQKHSRFYDVDSEKQFDTRARGSRQSRPFLKYFKMANKVPRNIDGSHRMDSYSRSNSIEDMKYYNLN